MSDYDWEFEKGDLVLQEYVYEDEDYFTRAGDPSTKIARRRRWEILHRHPGVPIADLHNEVDELWDFIDSLAIETTVPRQEATPEIMRCDPLSLSHARAFRAAREAAKEPKLEEGQEVWVRGTVTAVETPERVRLDIRSANICFASVHLGDIRTEKP